MPSTGPVVAALIGVPDPGTIDDTSYDALLGVENDLDGYRELLLTLGDGVTIHEQPDDTTAESLGAFLNGVADTLKPGDMFVLVIVGHGDQAEDADRDEDDGWDEVYAATGGYLVDDFFPPLWRRLKGRSIRSS